MSVLGLSSYVDLSHVLTYHTATLTLMHLKQNVFRGALQNLKLHPACPNPKPRLRKVFQIIKCQPHWPQLWHGGHLNHLTMVFE